MNQYNPTYNASYALVVGIDTYAHLKHLKTAVHGADAVGARLADKGFKVSALLDQQATRDAMIDWLTEIASVSAPDDRIFIYFAGHGASRRVVRGLGRVGYLMFYNTLNYGSALLMEDLLSEVRFIPAKHVFFGLDCCFSGLAIPETQPAPPRDGRSVEDLLRAGAVEILTAGQAGERVGDRLRGSTHAPFTHFLLEGLAGRAASADGAITSDTLAAYIINQMGARRRVHQTPAFYRAPNPGGEEAGGFVFVMPGAKAWACLFFALVGVTLMAISVGFSLTSPVQMCGPVCASHFMT